MAMTEERTRAYKASFVPVQRLLDAGRFPDAVAELERLTAANTECAEAHNDLAVLYHAAGRLVDADRESRRALELDPFHADIRDNRNAIATALGNASAGSAAAPASPALAAPAAASPRAAPAPFAPPVSVSAHGDRAADDLGARGAPLYSEVLRTAETLLASGPARRRGRRDRALRRQAAGDRRSLERPGRAPPRRGPLRGREGGAGRRADHRAAPTARRATTSRACCWRWAQPAEALRTLEPFLTRAPRDPEALTLAGDISFALHQSDDAGAFYRAALAVDPSNVEVAVKLANAAATPFAAPAAAPAPIAASPAPAFYLPPPAPPAAPAGRCPTPCARWNTIPRVRLVTPDETYDTVTCKIPLDRLPDPIAALAEMARLLKPGGKIWIDLGGPLEVIKHGAPKAPANGAVIDLLPAFRAR